jgi:hypothetical protein
MMRRIGPLLTVVLGLCLTCAWAQTDTGAPDNSAPKPAAGYPEQPDQPGPKPAFTYPDTTPSLDFLSTSIESSSITLGIGAGFSFDSNGYPNTNTAQNRWLYNISPFIKIQQFLPKLAWHASYAGGYQAYNQISGPATQNNNLFSQIAGAGFLWQMARHWQLSGDDSYRYSANPFDSYLTIAGTPSVNNPNAVSYYPLSNFTQNNAFLTLTDQITKRDVLAFTGTENLRRTSNYNIVTSVPFYNLTSYGGRANYSHVISPRLTLGVGYDYNSLDFGRGQQRSDIQTISFTGDYQINRNMTISGWIGPEYTSTRTTLFGESIYSTLWSPALGVNFGWRDLRNSVRASYSRQVSDGGGITATSQTNIAMASYRRQIARKWSGILGGRYSHNVSTVTAGRSFENYYVDVGVGYQISKSFQANANYIRVHQTQSNGFLIGPNTYNDNRVGVSISYSWSHPLGR